MFDANPQVGAEPGSSCPACSCLFFKPKARSPSRLLQAQLSTSCVVSHRRRQMRPRFLWPSPKQMPGAAPGSAACLWDLVPRPEMGSVCPHRRVVSGPTRMRTGRAEAQPGRQHKPGLAVTSPTRGADTALCSGRARAPGLGPGCRCSFRRGRVPTRASVVRRPAGQSGGGEAALPLVVSPRSGSQPVGREQ